MAILKAKTSNTRHNLSTRVIACALAALLIACFQLSPYCTAFAADTGKSDDPEKEEPRKSDDRDEDKASKKKKKDEDEEEDEEEQERKAKEKEADKKREEGDKIFDQIDVLDAKYADAQEALSAAQSALDTALAQRDETEQRLAEERERFESLRSELSEFAVDMYKQGGVTPYLDVVLRSTSYQDFVTSWNALKTIYQQGEEKAAEMRAAQEQIETELAACKEQVTQAERAVAIATSKKRQIRATQLSLTVQAWNIYAEAAEIVDDEEEAEEAKARAEEAQEELDEVLKEGLAGENLIVGDGVFAHPCPDGTVSSGFGYRSFDRSEHKGIDLAAPEGTPYYAAEEGTVTAATNGGGYNGGAGNWIVIDHGDGIVTKYMHSLVTFVTVGDHVERGQNIGLVGNTGNSTGPHLHFQVEVSGVAVDPSTFFNSK